MVWLTLCFLLLAVSAGIVRFSGTAVGAVWPLDVAFVGCVAGFLVCLIMLLTRYAHTSAAKSRQDDASGRP